MYHCNICGFDENRRKSGGKAPMCCGSGMVHIDPGKARSSGPLKEAVTLLKFLSDYGCSCTEDNHPCPMCRARDFITEFDTVMTTRKGATTPLENPGVRPRVQEDASRALLTDMLKEVDRLRSEVKRLMKDGLYDLMQDQIDKLTKECDKWHGSWKDLHEERQELRDLLGVPIPSGEGTVIQEFGPRYPLLESAMMIVKERDVALVENAKLRADFPPAPPLPVLNCKCQACEYLRRKQEGVK